MVQRILLFIALLVTGGIYTPTSYATAVNAPEVMFSPKGGITDRIIDLIGKANKNIRVAIYMITDIRLARALEDAQARGVQVLMIVDPASNGQSGKADYLASRGVSVYLYNNAGKNNKGGFSFAPLMHNKLMVVDDETFVIGSFNWTVKADRENEENILIMTNKNLCGIYTTYFNSLLNKCKMLHGRTSVAMTQRPITKQSLRQRLQQAINAALNDEQLKERVQVIVGAA